MICFDEFNLVEAMKTAPNFASAFIKSFMTICPDRLKRAYFVTGTIGHLFYKLANALAPKSIMEKVVEIRSREDAAALMVQDGVLKDEKDVPTFMGGNNNHDESITTDFKMMIETIAREMTTVVPITSDIRESESVPRVSVSHDLGASDYGLNSRNATSQDIY